ncbi:glycosyl transferase family 4 [Desulfofarcimen acetoxidans DSM 771]|jgi:UDP-GlcNAc:undecaprenyl-phosphate GlcNAc-1-phosphate transferase|uniref:Glycosyl transferase family 4 n=1 Tax=Desulfofarcimen acetoxidans (strain ATCC 49208 / DSM 771 / KCTC 5769 / VKM B-1644 / 5575) TaxID=485916 RepID=C8VYR2_DESAS|nr:MraY family glycosyltransferase [Desulfofarcimen acetoxidans]ACV64783.1 glycosyl transferase family 4 [Desulfofarcimen acetoxidans DSM 771]
MVLKPVLLVLASLFISLLATPQVIKLAYRWGALDQPDPRKVHRKIMPRLGGLAVYLSFIAGILLMGQLTSPVIGLIIGSTLIVLLGIVDDIKGISPRVKLLGQVLVAFSVLPFGISVDFITNPINGDILHLGFLSIPVTVFWLVAVTNAVNLIDGLDGLAGGTSLISAVTLAVVSWTQWRVFGLPEQMQVILMALILAASLLGFLRYNFNPAKIFLGDTGSMMLGFCLAAMSVMGLTKSTTAISVIIPLVILGIPLLDTVFAVVRRYNMHQPIFKADKEHLHHRLLALGLSHKQAVLAIYGVSAFLGLSAVMLNLITTNQAILVLVVLAVVIITAANKIGIIGHKRQPAYQISSGAVEMEKRSSEI